jgi:hypothetical protein
MGCDACATTIVINDYFAVQIQSTLVILLGVPDAHLP